MTNPKITLIIPTRERCDVLASSLRTATTQDYDNLEILVSDNCSTDATQEVVAQARDSRIRYLNTNKRLSMSHNWEFALSHVKGGWVGVMGDDDGLMPGAVQKVAETIQSSNTRSIRSLPCMYRWPLVAGNAGGRLFVRSGSGNAVRNGQQWLRKVLLGRATYPQLPVIYNGGFTRFDVMEAIKHKTGAFFKSLTPDVYSGVAIASVVGTYTFLNYPLLVDGTSRHSTGYAGFYAKPTDNTAAASTFYSEGTIQSHPDVPRLPNGMLPASYQALTYEAYLQCEQIEGFDPPDRREQLKFILATATTHREDVERWGRLFAAQHNIDYASAERSAFITRMWLQPTLQARKVANALRMTIADDLPIRNVYEASLAAAVIRAHPSWKGTARFLAQELSKHLSR